MTRTLSPAIQEALLVALSTCGLRIELDTGEERLFTVPRLSPAEQTIQDRAQATHEAIAALATAQLALGIARDQGLNVAMAAAAHRACEGVVQDCVKDEVKAHMMWLEVRGA